jgi:hypothetical protein
MTQSPRAATQGCRDFRRTTALSRRQLLEAGTVGALGLGLPGWWHALQAATAERRPAKACIFLFMWGGPSQLDTFDLKPNAPVEVRGSFNPIATRVPGLQICEHFTRLSQMTDKVAIIRSLTHDDPAHLSSGHATLTGHVAPVVKSDATPPSRKDSPHLGAVLSKVRNSHSALPSFVTLPWKAFHPAAPGGEAPGQHGGFLGSEYDGLLLTGDPNDVSWKPPGLSLPQGVSYERLQSRFELMRELDAQRQQLQSAEATGQYRQHQSRALDLLSSTNVRDAFDLSREPDSVRDRYGRNIHGQCVLMARRLIEHGVPLVTVNWHNDGKNFWDTHGDNFNRLKNELIPPADLALTALLEDLEQRGLLSETLVAWVGEFGRRPQITAGNAGREHWPYCYSGLLAGGGIRGGAVYGASDKHAAHPASDAVTPQDFATTMLHALGAPTDGMLHDREGRPHRIASGKVLHSLLG